MYVCVYILIPTYFVFEQSVGILPLLGSIWVGRLSASVFGGESFAFLFEQNCLVSSGNVDFNLLLISYASEVCI